MTTIVLSLALSVSGLVATAILYSSVSHGSIARLLDASIVTVAPHIVDNIHSDYSSEIFSFAQSCDSRSRDLTHALAEVVAGMAPVGGAIAATALLYAFAAGTDASYLLVIWHPGSGVFFSHIALVSTAVTAAASLLFCATVVRLRSIQPARAVEIAAHVLLVPPVSEVGITGRAHTVTSIDGIETGNLSVESLKAVIDDMAESGRLHQVWSGQP